MLGQVDAMNRDSESISIKRLSEIEGDEVLVN